MNTVGSVTPRLPGKRQLLRHSGGNSIGYLKPEHIQVRKVLTMVALGLGSVLTVTGFC